MNNIKIIDIDILLISRILNLIYKLDILKLNYKRKIFSLNMIFYKIKILLLLESKR
jgi:hypothetical protein